MSHLWGGALVHARLLFGRGRANSLFPVLRSFRLFFAEVPAAFRSDIEHVPEFLAKHLGRPRALT